MVLDSFTGASVVSVITEIAEITAKATAPKRLSCEKQGKGAGVNVERRAVSGHPSLAFSPTPFGPDRTLWDHARVLKRKYFPKGVDLAPHSQAQLNRIARQLNERPRKTLDFETPAERFSQCVASTG